jgi:ankyrin repeat protein
MAISHSKLISLIASLGYPTNEGGMCFGIAAMGLQAIFAKDLATFERRLTFLGSIEEKDFKQRVEAAESKRKNLLAEYKKQLVQQLESPDNYKKNQFIDEQLTKDEQALIECRALMEGIAIHHHPEKFPQLFEPSSSSFTQNLSQTFCRTLPPTLVKKVPDQEDKDKRAKEESSIVKGSSFCSVYHEQDEKAYPHLKKESLKTELTAYFSLLREHLFTPALDSPIVLSLGSSNHQITVTYYPDKKQWLLINANNLPSQYFDNDKAIAEEVLKAFSYNECAAIITDIYFLSSEKTDVQERIEKCKKEELWQTLHTTDKEDTSDRWKLIDSTGSPWLYIAAKNNQLDTLERLLEKKDINPNAARNDGATPLYIAAHEGHLAIVKALLKHKDINPNTTTNADATPLHIAAQNGHLEIVDALLKHKDINPNVVRNDYTTPLYIAAEKGQHEIVHTLLKHETINPNAAENNGATPLFIAAQYGYGKIVDALLKHESINPNATLIMGGTALYIAAQKGHVDIIKALLSHRKKAPAVDKKEDALHRPIEANLSILLTIAMEKKRDTEFRALLKKHNIEMKDDKGILSQFTPLHAAVFFGHAEIVDELIAAGANIEDKVGGKITVLELALTMGYTGIADKIKSKMTLLDSRFPEAPAAFFSPKPPPNNRRISSTPGSTTCCILQLS